MDEMDIETLAERLQTLTREQSRLARILRLRTRVSTVVACYAVLLTIWGLTGFRPIVAKKSALLQPHRRDQYFSSLHPRLIVRLSTLILAPKLSRRNHSG